MSKISKIRDESEACWDQCGDDPRFAEGGPRADEFQSAFVEWENAWDEAEEALEEGDLAGAKEALEKCRALEAEYGDDSHARRAIARLDARGEVVS